LFGDRRRMLDHVDVERAESEIDNFILERNRERDEANELQELWRASEAHHRGRQREENRRAPGLNSRGIWRLSTPL
jgi:hypothetical protein